jgi:hypothetical protein
MTCHPPHSYHHQMPPVAEAINRPSSKFSNNGAGNRFVAASFAAKNIVLFSEETPCQSVSS